MLKMRYTHLQTCTLYGVVGCLIVCYLQPLYAKYIEAIYVLRTYGIVFVIIVVFKSVCFGCLVVWSLRLSIYQSGRISLAQFDSFHFGSVFFLCLLKYHLLTLSNSNNARLNDKCSHIRCAKALLMCIHTMQFHSASIRFCLFYLCVSFFPIFW